MIFKRYNFIHIINNIIYRGFMKKSYKIVGMLFLMTLILTSVLIVNVGYCKEKVTVYW